MNPTKFDYSKMDKIAKTLGLSGTDGRYTTKEGRELDLTACAPTRESMLMQIGLLSI